MKNTKYILILFSISCFVALLNSCRKRDNIETVFTKNRSIEFFKTNSPLQPQIQKIYDALKKQNEKTHFVNNLPSDAGNPIWNKIKIYNNNNTNIRSTNEDTLISAVIPLTNNNTNLSSLLKIDEVINDSFNLNIYTNSYFYVKTHESNLNVQRAKYLIGFFLKMDNFVFGTKIFNNIPKSCFPELVFQNLSHTTTSVKIDTTLNNERSSLQTSPCEIVETTAFVVNCPYPGQCTTPCDALSQGGCKAALGNARCSLSIQYLSSCIVMDPGEPIGGGPGYIGTGNTGSGTGGTPTGGGGGPTGGNPTDPPCGGTWYRTDGPCTGEVGVGGGYDNLQSQLAQWDLNNIIVDSTLPPCIRQVMDSIKAIQAGQFAKIIKVFSNNVPGFDWKVIKVNYAAATPGANATTYYTTNGNFAYTLLHQPTMPNATNLFHSGVLIHEALHAFLISYYYNSTTLSQAFKDSMLLQPYGKQFEEYARITTIDNSSQHYLMVQMRTTIKEAIFNYCKMNNIGSNDTKRLEIAYDMSWMGLQDTDFFNDQFPLQSDKDGIKGRWEAERTNNAQINYASSGVDFYVEGIKNCN